VQKINSTNTFVSVFLSGLQQAAEGLEILIKTNLVIVYSTLKAQLTQMRTTIRNLQGVNGSISSAQLTSKEKETLVTLLQNLYLIQGYVKS
jgi:prefoldin subunit 5